jgi:NTP pyrophosphatase (non-canonical NTP hydrolase)
VSDLHGLITKVVGWGYNNGIMNNTDPSRQYIKCVSEVGELGDEILKGNEEKAKMELGDVLVTLCMVAEKLDTTLEECLSLAYEKISKRTGKTVNGVFIKDET